MEWVDDQHLAVDHAIPVWHGLGAELALPPNHRLKVVVHHPLGEERAFRERAPPASLASVGRPSRRQGYGDSLLNYSWVHPFQECFKTIKPITPAGAVEFQPIHYRRQCIGPRAIVRFASLAAMPYQPCPLQHRQMLGDGRLRYARIVSQCVDGQFALPSQLLENGPASRIGESAEHGIDMGWLHTPNHNRTVMNLSRES